MAAHTLSTLLDGLKQLKVQGDTDIAIGGVRYDSREVREGDLFFAIPGEHTDGHRYIAEALDAGASAIVHQRRVPESKSSAAVFVQTPSVRRALSIAAASFYDHPSRELCCIGITGTDGKSTTAYLLYQLLAALGLRAGLLSTVLVDTGTGTRANPFRQSTPEAPEVHQLLSEMRSSGLNYAVVEATSHGLSEKTERLADVWWRGAVMTNVSHEHLEFHGSFERYRSDKTRLFAALDRELSGAPFGEFAVINSDDPSADVFREATSRRLYTYSATGRPADVRAVDVDIAVDSAQFKIEVEGARYDAQLELPGGFNIANSLAALIGAKAATHSAWAPVIEKLPSLRPLKGRMERVDEGQSFSVIVDFAHTPGSFEQVLPQVRDLTGGRLIVVFGSAGERDRRKRKLQGRVADRYADVIILADEDPRGEKPQRILEEIAVGCRRHRREHDLFLVPDRREAIRRALRLATVGDTVLLLGKGHESSILYNDRAVDWNELTITRELLNDMGYRNG